MISRNSALRKGAVAFAAVALVAANSVRVCARDKEFGLLVRHIESQYHVKRSHRFILGFAGFVVRVWRPYGVGNFRVALFQGHGIMATGFVDGPAGQDGSDFTEVVRTGLNQGWQPIVRVFSRRDREYTYIFAKPAGKDFKLLISTVDQGAAVVIQVKLNPEKLDKLLRDEETGSKGLRFKDQAADVDGHEAFGGPLRAAAIRA